MACLFSTVREKVLTTLPMDCWSDGEGLLSIHTLPESLISRSIECTLVSCFSFPGEIILSEIDHGTITRNFTEVVPRLTGGVVSSLGVWHDVMALSLGENRWASFRRAKAFFCTYQQQ